MPPTPSVALLFNSARAHTVADPLDAVGVPCEINPGDAVNADVIVTDSLGSDLFHWVRRDARVFFRLRGDMWQERSEAGRSRLGSWLDDALKFRLLDGVIVPDSCLARRMRRRPGSVPTSIIGLPVDAPQWPVEYHDRERLELLTLTNMDYLDKIAPLERWIEGLHPWLEATRSGWTIAGDGQHRDTVRQWANDASRVRVPGFVDAKRALRRSDVVLHPSRFDIQTPNAILEAYASGVPVLTNDFDPFVGIHETVGTVDELHATLSEYQDVEQRRGRGEEIQAYVESRHSPEVIGQQYRRVLQQRRGETSEVVRA